MKNQKQVKLAQSLHSDNKITLNDLLRSTEICWDETRAVDVFVDLARYAEICSVEICQDLA